MASTGFNFVLSYSAVEHQSQKEDFLLFDCEIVTLHEPKLNAIECTMILGRPLSCPDLRAGADVSAFCTP